MSFVVEIHPFDASKGTADQIARSANQHLELVRLYAARGVLVVSSNEIITEEAEPDAQSWPLEADAARRLSQTVEWLAERLPSGYGFVAGWVGDEIESEIAISASDLADLIRRRELPQRTRFTITSETSD